MTAPLSPLPPVTGGRDARPAGRIMVDILVEDHHQLRILCADLSDLAGQQVRRVRVANVLTAVLTRHLSAEQQYLLPTVRAVLPDGAPLADQQLAADAEMLRTLRRLGAERPGDDGYERLVHAVCAQVARHVQGASRHVFPRLRAACPEVDLVRLGNRVEIAKEAAPTRPHPSTPATPPWNKLIDPAVGVADKIRDVLARRVTYPRDL